jgi:8-amino-7-oxononanoate synthase
MSLTELLHYQQQQLKNQGLYRKRIVWDCKTHLVNFSSNDYLSFTTDKRIRKAFAKGFRCYPAGSGASMVLSGYQPIHQQVERLFATQLGVDAALLFSSGYAANLGVTALLAQLNAPLLIDKAMHASIYDGLALKKTPFQRFLHNDFVDLIRKMNTCYPNKSVVLTEAIFSMSGQQPDLGKLAACCYQYQGVCVIDEAHSFGIVGPQGLGAVLAAGLDQKQVPLRILAFGKAMGVQGAMVVGDGVWVDALFQAARSQRYSTAISPALAYGLIEGLTLLMQANDKRQALMNNIVYFKQAIKQSPLTWQASDSPIQQLQLGCPKKALDAADYLQKNGILCAAIRQPTVSRAATGLRITLNAHHNTDDIDLLLTLLHRGHYA